MNVDLWILVLLALVSPGVNTLKMDAQYGRDLIEEWQIMLGFKNFQGHVFTIFTVIPMIEIGRASCRERVLVAV